MADNIQINTGTSGVYVKTKEVAAGTHAGYTILADTAGALFGVAANPVVIAPSATGTQVCSIAATVPVSGAFYQSTQPVSVAATVPVSGAFYQSTQPVSCAATVPVSGAFYQATQPVSIAAAATVPVSGDFYQSTQPVSCAATVPVSGAFYQATQPVSGSVAISSIPVLSATNVTIASITTGTVSVVSMPVLSATNVTIASIATGSVSIVNSPVVTATVSVMPVLSATNVTIASIATGSVSIVNSPVVTATVSVMPVLSATNVTIASIATGTVSLSNATIEHSAGATSGVDGLVVGGKFQSSPGSVDDGDYAILNVDNVGSPICTVKSGTVSISGTVPVIQTHHASNFSAYVITTTNTSTIIKTSGAHTLYITDMVFSVDVPMNLSWRSATTEKGLVYLAAKGGFVVNLRSPLALNSAESLTMLPSASGSCSAFVCGYTVT